MQRLELEKFSSFLSKQAPSDRAGGWRSAARQRIAAHPTELGHRVQRSPKQATLADDDDPRNHNSNTFTANMGMGRNGTEHNRNAFAVWS